MQTPSESDIDQVIETQIRGWIEDKYSCPICHHHRQKQHGLGGCLICECRNERVA